MNFRILIVLALLAGTARADPATSNTAAGGPAAAPKTEVSALPQVVSKIPLQPVEADSTPFPDDKSETVNVIAGDKKDQYFYAFASGYVKAPIAKVEAALRQPEVLIDHRRVDTYKVEVPTDPALTYFRVHNTVHGLAVVDFDITWKQGVFLGTAAKPKAYVARGKFTGGSGLIHEVDDSVTLRPVDAHTTSVEIVRHLRATNIGPKDAEQYARDVFSNLVAKSHDQELPKYR